MPAENLPQGSVGSLGWKAPGWGASSHYHHLPSLSPPPEILNYFCHHHNLFPANHQAFPGMAPGLWNASLEEIQQATSIVASKQQLQIFQGGAVACWQGVHFAYRRQQVLGKTFSWQWLSWLSEWTALSFMDQCLALYIAVSYENRMTWRVGLHSSGANPGISSQKKKI